MLTYKHLDAILNNTIVTQATFGTISKLVDDHKKHLAALKSLDLSVKQIHDLKMVRQLEYSLPPQIKHEWDDSLSADEIPTLKKLYQFLRKQSFKCCNREQDSIVKPETKNKRFIEQSYNSKFCKNKFRSRVLVTNIPRPCIKCNESHPLYKCPSFKKLGVQEQWDFVKSKKLCFNSLRPAHGEKSPSSNHCKKWLKFHHSLLHHSKNKKKLNDKINQPSAVNTNLNNTKS